MELDELIKYVFIGLSAMGGGVGFARLFFVRTINKKIESQSAKTGIEATAIFSDSILKMLQSAQVTAEKAIKDADTARATAQQCKEEIAYLRAWIIEQGLVPPPKLKFTKARLGEA